MTHSDLVMKDSRKRAEAKALTNRVVLYSLFQKDTNTGRYKRINDSAYNEKLACRVFSARLAEAPLSRAIKPIKIESLEAR